MTSSIWKEYGKNFSFLRSMKMIKKNKKALKVTTQKMRMFKISHSKRNFNEICWMCPTFLKMT